MLGPQISAVFCVCRRRPAGGTPLAVWTNSAGRKSSDFLLKAQFELSVIFCTVRKVEIYQILIANPGFLGQGFEVTDGLGINANRDLLFELPCVGVGCGLREIVFGFHTVPPYQVDSFLVAFLAEIILMLSSFSR